MEETKKKNPSAFTKLVTMENNTCDIPPPPVLPAGCPLMRRPTSLLPTAVAAAAATSPAAAVPLCLVMQMTLGGNASLNA